jgi:hydrogenase maturation protease
MSVEARPEIVVLGLGNLMRTDDGVGIHAVRRLAESGRLPSGVRVIEGGTLGLDLLPHIEGTTNLLAIDAVEHGMPPGSLSRFANKELSTLPTGSSAHLLGFSDLISALRLLGAAPRDVVLLGVQPQSTDWGIKLSPCVSAGLVDLLEVSLSVVAGWSSGKRPGVT